MAGVDGEVRKAAPGADRPRAVRRELSDRTLLLVTAVVTLPVLWMGYGTDIDVHDVLASGESIRRGDYMPSRPPGVPVFEALVAALDPLGGHLLVNLATAVAGAAAVVGVAHLVRTWGHAHGDLVALAVLASPVTLVAATSTGDFIWALAFLLWGAVVHRADRTTLAGVLFALAVGTRLSSALLVAAVLVADGWDRERRRACLRTALVMAPLAVLFYVPSWLAYDRSLDFLESAEGWRSVANNAGRFAYKTYVTFGGVALVVLALAVPALVGALRRWRVDPLLRLGVLGTSVAAGMYFVFPWKFPHLLPALVMLLVWVAASARNRRPFLCVLIAALALNGLVTVRLLTPDKAAEASTGSWDPAVTLGLFANDIACRADAMDEPVRPLNRGAWACSLTPMRGDMPEPEPTDPRDDAGRDDPRRGDEASAPAAPRVPAAQPVRGTVAARWATERSG